MKWTKEQLLIEGMELRRLTASSGFDVAIELLRADYLNRIAGSSYADNAGREQTYRKLVALEDLVGVIKTLAVSAEQELLRSEDDQE